MHTVCLPASCWFSERAASTTVIRRVANRPSADPISLVVDHETVLRQESAVQDGRGLMEIAFRDWVKTTAGDGEVIDVEAIRAACRVMKDDTLVVLEASGFRSEIIVEALAQARIGLYSLNAWPDVFVIVVDDTQKFQIAPLLSTAFHIQPSILAPTSVQRITQQLADDGKLHRLFGRNLGTAAVHIRNWLKRRQAKRDSKALRGVGWLWEE